MLKKRMSLLGIDIGTTGCKAIAYDLQGRQLALSYREYETVRAKEGLAELNSIEVWEKVLTTIREVAQQTVHDPVEALSVSSIGEALVPVTTDRKILGNSILGTDCRGKEYIGQLLAKITPSEVYTITGNLPGTFYSISKLMWINNSLNNLYRSTDFFLSWADFVCFMLGGKPVANYSLASRTLLLDRHTFNWSEELLSASGVEFTKLALPCPSGCHLGYVEKKLAGILGLNENVSIVSGGHDQCCAVLGSGVKSGSRSAMYGLGTFLCVAPVLPEIPDEEYMYEKKMHIEPHVVPGASVSFIYNLSGGALIKWFKNVFGGQQKTYTELFGEITGMPNSILAVPKFGAAGPPDFEPGGRGCFSGLSLSHSRGDILQAILEGTAFYVKDCFEKSGKIFNNIDTLMATGGGAISDKWLQITADILGRVIIRNKTTEASALGATMLAGVGSGKFASIDDAVDSMVQKDAVFYPATPKTGYYNDKFEQFEQFNNFLSP
jgi:xylulokinase